MMKCTKLNRAPELSLYVQDQASHLSARLHAVYMFTLTTRVTIRENPDTVNHYEEHELSLCGSFTNHQYQHTCVTHL